jgi:hypothetical protein
MVDGMLAVTGEVRGDQRVEFTYKNGGLKSVWIGAGKIVRYMQKSVQGKEKMTRLLRFRFTGSERDGDVLPLEVVDIIDVPPGRQSWQQRLKKCADGRHRDRDFVPVSD